jgi:hypothetical protein
LKWVAKDLSSLQNEERYAENIIVGTITDPTDENTFTAIETITLIRHSY